MMRVHERLWVQRREDTFSCFLLNSVGGLVQPPHHSRALSLQTPLTFVY